jgi:PAS domain S-box-containing protein
VIGGRSLWEHTRTGNVVTGMAVHMLDEQTTGGGVTHMKATEGARLEGERRLRQIIDLVPHFIFAKDVNGSFILVNQAVADAYGTTVEKLVGMTDAEFAKSKDEVRHFRKDDLSVIESRRPRIIPEENITDAQGRTRVLSTTKIPFTCSGSNAPAVLGVSVDVTELKQAQVALANERSLYMDLVASQPTGVYRLRVKDQKVWGETEWVGQVGTNYHLEMVSDRFCRILGVSREQCLADASIVVDSIHPEDRPAFVRRNVAALETLKSFEWKGRILSQEQVRWVHFSSVPRCMDNGDVVWTGVLLDISDIKTAEEAQQRMGMLESLGTVAGGIAHDFNNLLMGVFGNIELAAADLPPGHPARTSLVAAHQALDTARRLTGRLLTFAKGGSPVLETVDLRQSIFVAVRFHLSGSNVEARFDIPADLWPAKADKGQIAEVISNLTLNAKEAMTAGGTLHVQARNVRGPEDAPATGLRGAYVRLIFRDEGIGIPAAIIDRIFDPYFTTKQAGSGLGLAIVHGIVSKHQGYIAVESVPGAGTTFTVFIPAEFDEQPPCPARIVELAPPRARVAGHILLMDDESVVRQTATLMLERLGHTVETAQDGREAIAKYAAAMKSDRPFDVTIMDLTIPGGMGGKDAIRDLLALDPSARAIVASGYASDPVLADCARYGFIGQLAKPFVMSGLDDALSNALRPISSTTSP